MAGLVLISALFFIILIVEIVVINGSITCRDQNNKPVDWFIVYKLPRIDEDPDLRIQSGFAYYYLDVNAPYWTEGEVLLNETSQAIAYTLQQIYDNHKSQNVMYLLYNDETPEKNVTYSHGHTKGDVCFDNTSGFWLVHSLPRFPSYAASKYDYPWSGRVYGQTFLCVTYKYDTLNQIGQQFLYTYPQIYDFNVPELFHKDNPNIISTVNKSHVKTAPWNRTIDLTSMSGTKFKSFAKFTDFNADLYHDWLAPYYGSDVYVESWLNGKGSMTSNCSGSYKAFNIKQLNISRTLFNETHDHSKWAVTTKGSWICIGDINRQVSQYHRAGGTVCFDMYKVWMLFGSAIKVYQECPKPNQPQVLLNMLDPHNNG